jgi:membrane protein DedA with SNARE-associated domain
MKDLAIQIIDSYGYFGICILTFLESIVPIIPAEFILTLSGFATTFTQISKFGVVFFATAGELLGSLVLYSIGYYFNAEKLEKLTDKKIFRLVGFKSEDIYKSKEWFLNKGKFTVLFGRCIPVVGSLLSIPAGMSGMNFPLFVILTLIGISIWNTILVFFGATIKQSIDILILNSSPTMKLLAIVFIVCFIMIGFHYIYGRRAKHKA